MPCRRRSSVSILAKSVFQVHGVDVHGKVVVTKRLRRDAVLAQTGRIDGSNRLSMPSRYKKLLQGGGLLHGGRESKDYPDVC